MIAVAFHDGGGCFEGEIRSLTPQEQWEQFVQIRRAERIQRELAAPHYVAALRILHPHIRAAAAKGRVERHLGGRK